MDKIVLKNTTDKIVLKNTNDKIVVKNKTEKIVMKFNEAIRVNAQFTLGFDQETGKLQLLGKDNSILSEVDLPTEKVIKNAFYDDTTKELVIDFESNNQVRIPIDFTDEIEKAISDFENKVNEQFSQFQENVNVSFQEVNQKIDDLEKEINENVNEEINNLSQEISDIEQTINENINQQIDNLSGEINALEETINESVNQNIESLNSKIDGLEEEINTNINSQVETLNQKVDTLEDTINNNIGKQVESLNESIEEINNSKVDKVDGKQLSTNDLTNELLNKLNSLNNYDDTEIQKQIDEIKLILTTDDVDFDTLQKIVNALKNNVANINDIFTTLNQKASKDELPTKVSDLENDLGYLTQHQDISGKAEKTYVDEELQKKVDKVEGYNLSKNDFTDENLQKLNSLNNYDDSEIRDKIEEIEEKNATQDTTISNAQQTANEALAIAKGRTKATVFDTYLSMVEYLKNAKDNEFNIGDNLLIKELNVPDYWVSAILDNNSGYYGYYEISLLETQKVDLTNYVEKVEGKGLSTNDYTDDDKNKLSTLNNYNDSELRENITNLQNNKADKTSVPTKVSQLTNDENFASKEFVVEVLENATGGTDASSVKASLDAHISDKTNPHLVTSEQVGAYSKNQTNSLLESKVDKVDGKDLSTNDYTTQEKTKLANIEENANNYVLPSDVVKDSEYVHTDNNFTTIEKNKLASLQNYDDTLIYNKLNEKEDKSKLKALAYKDSLSKGDVGLGNVDNTSDLDKPISTATQEALDNKADKSEILKKVSQLENDSGFTNNIGTVTSVKVGTTSYNPSSGVVSLPAYPTSLPASDVYSWAKASSKPSYTKSEVGLSNVTNDSQVKRSEMGTSNGVATLDSNGKVPTSQLPSYVDDVIEGTYVSSTTFKNTSGTVITGETGKIYVDTTNNKTYRWSGSSYVEISSSLALGETSSTAYAGDKGKANATNIANILNGTTAVPNATTSTKVGSSNVGGTTTPIYLEAGVPKPLSYTIATSVPANAKFTDTDTGVTSVTTTGNGNAVTSATYDSSTRKLTLTKGTSFLPLSGGTVSGNITATTFTEDKLLLTRKYGTLLPFGTQIGANINLNTTEYIKVGNYFCSANTTVETLTNCPTTKAFMMQVYSPLATSFDNETTSKYIYRLRKLLTYIGDEYIQQISSGATAGTFTYGAWKKITKSDDLTNYSTLANTIKSLSVSGKVITYTKGDGNTGTITTQDTWRGIVDNLTSTSTTESLSAKQGKVLNDKFASYLTTASASETYQPKGKITVTDTTPTSATKYFPVYTYEQTGSATARVNKDLYYYDSGTWSSFNIGGNANMGILTLHYGNSSTDYMADIKPEKSFTANRSILIPDKSGTLALTSDLANYLPLTGGELSGGINIKNTTTATTGVGYGAYTGNIPLITNTALASTAQKLSFMGSQGGRVEFTMPSTSGTLALKSEIPTVTDTKVTQAYSTTNAYYPLLFSATSGITSTSSRGATTSILCNKIYANPSTGSLETSSLTTGDITCSSLSSDGGITASGNISADEGNISAGGYVRVYDDGDAYTGTDNFDGDDVDTNYYAKGIIVGGSYKLAFPAKSGTIATTSDYITAGKKSGTTMGSYATAEGYQNTVGGSYAHAEGYQNTANGHYSHAEGTSTSAMANGSHAEGYGTYAEGVYSHAGGYGTHSNAYQYVVGKYNTKVTGLSSLTDTTASKGIFIVGIGTSNSARRNGFRVNPAGNVYGVGSFATSGADYAEYFEWLDGNPNNEDRRGRFVTLEGEKIRYANSNDEYILGVVSSNPSMAGDVQSEDWHGRYLKDVFGSPIVEVVEVEETTNEDGEIIPAHIERRFVLNPNYNPNANYVSREERPEWSAIGLVGKLVVVDDGTCQVNGYCYPNANGIATISQEKTNYRVIERLDDTHIRIFIK